MKTWHIVFSLKDTGKIGGYFSKLDIIDMIKQIQTAGLEVRNIQVTDISNLVKE